MNKIVSLEILSDIENKFLLRREVTSIFPSASGHLTREQALVIMGKNLKLVNEKIYLISLLGSSGRSDLKGLFYIYRDENEAKSQLAKYIFERNSPKKKEVAEDKKDS